MLKKKISVMLFFLMLCGFSSALQDANITVIAPDTNICLSDSLNRSLTFCDNQVLVIDGTQDHIIYISNSMPLSNISANTTQTFIYFVNQPVGWIAGLLIIIFYLISFFATIIVIYMFFIFVMWLLGVK